MTASPLLILASASPRRVDLLRQIHYEPQLIVPADINETPLSNETPKALALRLALAKAETVAVNYSHDFVLAADTVVACGRRILPKTETLEEAQNCLRILSGRRHKVYGGICLIAPQSGGVRRQSIRLSVSEVLFKRLSPAELAVYLASNEWHGKAGGYAIQGLAAGFIKRLAGSYSNIVGLSLYDAAALLNGFGYASSLRSPQ